jgi:hypothetical protein
MKVFVSLDLPYDRYLPQWSVTFHYKPMMRSMPPSPAADEPDEPPPREAVVSEHTKQ